MNILYQFQQKHLKTGIAIFAFLFSLSSFSQNVLTQNFDGTFPPSGWTNTAAGSGLTFAGYTTSYQPSGISPKAGAAMAGLNSWSVSSGTATLISSSFSLTARGSQPVQFSIWVFREDGFYPTTYDSLAFSVNTSASTSGEVLIGSVRRTLTDPNYTVSTPGWYQYNFSIPSSYSGGTNYIIIEGTSLYGDDIYIDEASVDILQPMVFSSTTTLQASTSPVGQGSTNQAILNLQVVTAGLNSPLTLTSAVFSTSGTTNVADVTKAKLFYTGNSSTFVNGTQVGSIISSPSGTFTISGTQTLVAGVNNFWLTYDISNTATPNNVVDATCSQVTVSSVNHTPTLTNPSGSRSIYAQTFVISPTGDGGFENGNTFSANGWTVVNGATNQWFVGSTAGASAGSNSAYISDNATGTTYNYNTSSSSTVHFYRDVTFPSGLGNITLSFRWKGQGEGSYDYVTVYSMPTSVTPSYNSPAGGYQSWTSIPSTYSGAVVHASPNNLNLQSAYQTQSICLPASYAGTTRRLVFMWSNDGSVGTQPPGSIDEITLTSSQASAPTSQPTTLVLTPSTTQISGSFTAASSATDGYLVVRYPSGATPVNPVNGTTYAIGNSIGTGKVVFAGSATTFVATGLLPLTTHDFYAYSYNSPSCAGILYNTTSPLTGTQTTSTCSGLSGTYTVGPTGNYTSITAALAAAGNGLSSSVIFELQSTYVSTVEAFPLVIPFNVCVNSGRTITIRPQTGATALSITSSNASGTLTFDNGSFVTIDGRAGGTGAMQLTISNTGATGYAVQFINNATFNTIKYCQLTGVNTSLTSGVIYFNNAVGFTTGNSNNTIDNCDIHDAATTPTNLVYVSGNTTDYISGNNNNQISNSTLHDWFNASTTGTSINSTTVSGGAAINIAGGASDWTITGNSFYQTATRTFTMVVATTGVDQSAVFVNSSTFGNNFTISNNFFGGSAPSCGGTPWTYTGGATGTPTVRMVNLITASGAPTNVTGNTFANISITTASSSTRSGMIVHQNGNINVTNNTIGSQSATGNITFTLTSASAVFFLPIGCGTNTLTAPSIINITNNNIGGITATTTSTGNVSFRILYAAPASVGSKVNINNNIAGGTVANSILQQTNNLVTGCMILNPSFADTVSNNIIRNITQDNTSATIGSLTGINLQNAGADVVTGNTVYNLISNAPATSINNAASIVGIDVTPLTGTILGNNIVTGNTVYNLNNTNTTAATWVNGIYFLGTSAPQPISIVAKNFVHTINLASSVAGSGMAGLLFTSGIANIYNNIFRLGIDSGGSSITTPLQINGIYAVSGGNSSINFNTVCIGGTGVVSGTVNTYSYRRASSGLVDTVMNNVFCNARSNASGTGKNYAMNLFAATALVSNFNDIFVTGTGGVLGINGATDYTTLTSWRTGTIQDWNSVSGDPQFVNPNGNLSTVNMHINASVASPVEQAGYNLPYINDDIDGQARASLSPVDIGADAGNFTVLDLAPPVISLVPSVFTCSTGDRTIAGVVITDATGVPISGTLRPRIYYKKNSGSYFSQPGTLSSGSATNGTWSFTIVSADMSGLTVGDVVSYYVIAQDNVGTPNIGSYPAGVIASSVNSITSPPITPITYAVNAGSLTGTYSVGASQTYPTLTAAIAAYNTSCLNGAIVFQLTDASYSASETFPIIINNNPYASATNTLTIRPASGINATITGLTGSTALIKMFNARYITVDGVNTGGSKLTLTNANTSTASANIWLASTATNGPGCNNIKILNTVIVGGSNSVTTDYGIIAGVDGATPSATAGPNNDFITIQGDSIQRCYYGVYGIGATLFSAGGLDNWNISNNIIGPSSNGTNNLGLSGIVISNAVNSSITNNAVQFVGSSTFTSASVGINLSNVNGFTLSQNNINNVIASASVSGLSSVSALLMGTNVVNTNVTRNNISSIYNVSTGGWGCRAIIINTSVSNSNITLSNNMISDITSYSDASSSYWPLGIDIDGVSGGINVYFNSINFFGSHPGLTSATGAVPLFINTLGNNLNIRDNIFVNTYVNTSSSTSKMYAIYSTGFASQFADINYNDYYVSGINILGFIAGADRVSLSALQSGFGSNANSVNKLPVFVSNTNLILYTATAVNYCFDGLGVTIPSIPIDDDGDIRSVPPDIGADELNLTITALATPSTQSICAPTNLGIVFSGSPSTFSWTRNNTTAVTGITASGTGNISGVVTNTTGLPVTVTFNIVTDIFGCPGPPLVATVVVNPGVPTIAAFTGSPNAVSSGPPFTSFSNTNAAATYAVPFVAGVNYSWSIANGTITSGGTTNSVNVLWGPVNGAIGKIKLTETNSVSPCVKTDSVMVSLGCSSFPPPYTAATLVLPTTVCAGSTYTYAVTPITGYLYKWVVTGGTISGAANGTSVTVIWGSGSTTASVRITDSVGCAPSSTPINIVVNALPTAIIAGPTSVCANSLIAYSLGSITGTIGTYAWVVTGGTITSGQGTAFVNVSWGAAGAGTLKANLTSNLGCAGGTPIFNVNINGNPTATFTGTTTVCTGTSYTYNASSSGSTYNWTVIGGNIASQSSNTVTIIWSNVATASLSLKEILSTGCTGSTTQTITVNGPLTLNASGPQQVCVNSSATYSVTGVNVTNATVTNGTITSSTATTATILWTATGTAAITITYSNGSCSYNATYFVNVNPLPTPSVTGSNSVCTGTTTNYTVANNPGRVYVWNVSSGGTIIAGQGSSAISVLWNTAGANTVSVNETISVTGCSATSNNFNVTVTTSPSSSITGSANVCSGGTFTYTAPTATTYAWTVSGGTISGAANASSVNVVWGTGVSGSLTLVASNGICNSTSTLPVIINATPAPTITGASAICSGTANIYSTSFNSNYTYIWTVTNGTYTFGGNSNIINVTPNAGATTVTVALSASLNATTCSGSASTIVTVNASPTVTLNGNTIVCRNSSQTYTASGASSYNFDVSGGVITATTATTATITWGPVNGTVYVTGSGAGGCAASASLPVIVNPLPITLISGSAAVCANNSSNYSVALQGGATYSWTATGGSISGSSTGNSVNISWGAVGAGTVHVTVTNATGCADASTKNISINTQPTPSITSGPTCQNTNQTYSVTAVPGSAYNWSVSGGNIVSGVGTNSVTVVWTTPGVGTINITQSTGLCNAFASFTIPVNPAPPIPTVYKAGNTLLTDAIASTYQWYNGSTPITGATSPTYVATAPGIYTVVVTNASGCQASSTSIIANVGMNNWMALTDLKVYPNPSKDNITITVKLDKPQDVSINIYDINGKLVYTGAISNADANFTRTISLEGYASGVYMVQVIANDGSLQRRIIKE